LIFPLPNPQPRYLIRFVYVDYENKLRSKSHFVKAPKPDLAIEKVKNHYGKVKILRIEKE
jgi:hypothetical protein